MRSFAVLSLGLLALIGSAARGDEPTEKDVQRLLGQLYKDLQSPDVNTRRRAAAALDKASYMITGMTQHMSQALHDEDEKVRLHAANALGTVGIVDFAGHCLGHPAKLTIKELIVALQADKSKAVRAAAADALGLIGAVAKEVVPALVQGLNDEDGYVRERACAALGLIGLNERHYEAPEVLGPQAKRAVPALIAVIKDKKREASLRGRAAIALGYIGPDARAAVPALLAILKGDEPQELQGYTLIPLGMIGADEKEVIPALIAVLKDRKRASLHGGAAIALARFGPKARDAIPVMVQALDVRDVRDPKQAEMIQTQILDALGDMGPLAKEMIPVIEKLAHQEPSSNGIVPGAAKHALEKISR
jgi:HEAT repeat protein